MAKFNLTAQLGIQAPSSSNVNSVLNSLQSQFNKGVTVTVSVNGGSAAVNQLSKVRRETERVTSAAEEMGVAFGASLKRFAAFAVATRAVSLLTNSLAKSIDTAIIFQSQMIKIGQITEKSQQEIKPLANTIQRLAKDLGIASTELAGISDTLAQAGLSARDTEISLSALAKTKLAPSFGKIEETVEGAIAIMAQFKRGAGALEQQLGSVNEVAAKFAVESADLITVIRTAGGVFKASGGSLEELLALFTSVRATTRESAESISTGIRTIFTRIQRPETIANLRKIGIELTDLKGRFIGPYQAVQKLNDALKNFGERDPRFIQISEELGGFRQIGKVIPLLQQFELAEKARQAALSGGNSLNKAAEEGQKSLAVQIAKVREEFQNLINDIAQTSSFQNFIKLSLSLASSLIKVADSIKPLIPLIATFASIKIAQGVVGFGAGIGASLRGLRGKSDGGRIGFAGGGLVPGQGNGDTVPAMLTPGEFVIKKSSVNSIGADALHSMNKYATGGVVVNFAKLKTKKLDKSKTTLEDAISSGDYTRKQLANAEFGYGKAAVDAIAGTSQDAQRKSPKKSGSSIESKKRKYPGGVFQTIPGEIGGFFLNPAKGEDDDIESRGDKTFTTSKGLDAVLLSGSHIAGFTPSKRDLEKNLELDNIVTKNASIGISAGLRSAIPAFSQAVNMPPVISSADGKFGSTIERLSKDPNVVNTTAGFLFEGLIDALTGARLQGNQSSFDFPNLTGSYDKLVKLFGSDAIRKLKKGDAKKSRTEGPKIFNKVVNDLAKGDFTGVQKFAKGGKTDTVPAMLTPGEFVVNKSSAQKIGYNKLESMNKSGVAGFAAGGVVGFKKGGSVGDDEGFGVGKSTAILVGLSALATSAASTADANTLFGKTLQNTTQSLISASTSLVIFSGLMKSSNDAQKKLTEKINRIAQLNKRNDKLNDVVKTDTQSRNDIVSAINKKISGLSPGVQTGVDFARQQVVNLAPIIDNKKKQLAKAQASVAAGNVGGGQRVTDLTNELTRLETSMAKAVTYTKALIPEYESLDRATVRLTRSTKVAAKTQAAIDKGPKLTKLEAFGAKFIGISKALQATATGLTVVATAAQTYFQAMSDYNTELSESKLKSGDYAGSIKSAGDAASKGYYGNIASSVGQGAIAGAAIGSVVPVIGTAVGAIAGGAIGGTAAYVFGGSERGARKKGESKAALEAIEVSATKTQDILNTSFGTIGKSVDVSREFKARKTAISSIDPEDQHALQAAQEAYKNDILKTAQILSEQSISDKEILASTNNLVAGNAEYAKEITRVRDAVIAARKAQEALTKANYDALKVNAVLGAGATSLDNFLASIETGSNDLLNMSKILEDAQSNVTLSNKGKETADLAQSKILQQLGTDKNSSVGKAVVGTFDRYRAGQDFNAKFLQNIEDIKVTPGNDPESKQRVQDRLVGLAGNNEEVANIIRETISESKQDHFDTADLSKLQEEIQHKIVDKFGGAVVGITKTAGEANQKIIDLTRKRQQAEEKFVEAQKRAIDLQAEAASVAHEFGAALVTPAQKSAFNVAKFNVGNERLGIGGLRGGSGQDIAAASQEIGAKFAELQNKANVANAKGSGNAFGGVAGVDADQRDQLIKKSQELTEINRAQIAVKKEELELIKRKNQLEKNSIQKLVSGDIEGFLRGQGAAAASSAIRSGNTTLLSSFSSSSLGEALKAAQDRGDSSAELEKFSRAALGSLGVTDQRAIQVAAGTTAEEQRVNAEGRSLAGALSATGAASAAIEGMNVNAQEVIIQAANVQYKNAVLDSSAQIQNRFNGGMIYASLGRFIPRGTDTVPAMLTPGEMIVSRTAVNRGSNRNTIEHMNNGGTVGGGGYGISSEVASMLASSLTGFADAVEKLSQLKISVKLDATNVNVNLVGGSFLQNLSTQVKNEVMEEVSKQIRNIKFNNAGEVNSQNTVL